mgnify:CR=1 FL=1
MTRTEHSSADLPKESKEMKMPRYIPEGAREITRDGIDAVAYAYEANGKPLARSEEHTSELQSPL